MGKRQQSNFESNVVAGQGKKAKHSSSSFSGKKKLATMMRRMISQQAEHKELQVYNAIATAPLNATQTNLYLINGVAEGSDFNQRVGRSIKHAYIEVNVGLFSAVPLGDSSPGDFGFWAIVLDRQPGGALPAFNAIFDDGAQAGTGEGTCFRTTATNQDRFKILKRNEWAVGSCQNGAASNAMSGTAPYHEKVFIDLSKMRGNDAESKFNTTTGVIAAFTFGAIYFVIASSLSTANHTVQWAANTKYRFTDV